MNKKALTGLAGTCLFFMLQAGAVTTATNDVVLYASDVPASAIHGAWTSASDPTSPRSIKLSTPATGQSNMAAPLASPIDYVDVTLTANAGLPYTFWTRLEAVNNSKASDSVWVQFSDALASGTPIYPLNTTSALLVKLATDSTASSDINWGWVNSAYWLTQPATVTFATSGVHTVRVQVRGAGVKFDQIVLSPTTYLTTAPGLRTSDATIVARPVSTPFTGVAAALPGTVQAVNYDKGGEGLAYHDTTAGNSGNVYRQDDVDIEAATDGAYNVGWVAQSEWLAYSVNVASAGSYLLETRVASPGPGGTFHVELGGSNVTGALTIPATGDWQTWATVSKTVTLNAGPQLMKLVFDTAGPNGVDVGNVTWMRVSQVAASTSTPYTSALSLPNSFLAANYDKGGEGLAYHDTTSGNAGGAYRQDDVDIEKNSFGGYDVGWIADGEWLAYSVNVTAAGAYAINVQVASPGSTGQMHVRFGTVDSAPVTIPNTGGYQNWTSVSLTANLTAGPQIMRLVFDNGGFNVAGGSVTYAAAPPPPPPPPPPGTFNVVAGGDFQAALNAAQPGDTILLQAGATFVGNFVLPAKTGAAFITIRSSAADATLPAGNVRIDPSYAPALPKLHSPNTMAPLATAAGAHNYRLMFLEFLGNPTAAGDLLDLGDGSSAQNSLALVPHDLVVDRVYMHGDPIIGQKRAIGLNSASTTIENSYIGTIMANGQDSQAIASWNGPGPYVITNNYLEAAGENIIFGGDDPAIPLLVASDITITHNHLSKQLAWQSQPAWNVKNLLELKNAQRVLIDSNLMDYNWLAAQDGFAVLFTPRNQYGGAPWTVVQDVQFTHNIVRHVSSGINILGTDYINPSQETNNILIQNNLFDDVSVKYGGYGRFILLNGGSAITIDHNTIIQDGMSAVFADTNPTLGFVLTNNIMPDYSWVIIGTNMAPGNSTINFYFPNSTIQDGIFAGSNPKLYPGGNYYPATMAGVGFIDLAGGNYRLSPSSIYLRAGTDGADVGCNIDGLASAMQQ